jgi:hypothetical protein
MPFDGAELNETATTLLRARQYLVERGWCKGAFGDDGSPRCMVGAILSATGARGCFDPLILGAMRALKSVTGSPGTVVGWNDAPDRTEQEVLDAFDRAAAIAHSASL